MKLWYSSATEGQQSFFMVKSIYQVHCCTYVPHMYFFVTDLAENSSRNSGVKQPRGSTYCVQESLKIEGLNCGFVKWIKNVEVDLGRGAAWRVINV